MFGYTAEEIIGKPITDPDTAGSPRTRSPTILDRIRRGERVEPYETVRLRKDGTPGRYFHQTVSPIKNAYGRVVGASKIAHDIGERKRTEKLLRTVMHELSHRSKNLLSVIQAMAQQTARLSPSVETFLDRFNARIHGLAASQDLLVSQDWSGALLEDLVRQQLLPFGEGDGGRVELKGPPLLVTPDAAQTLGLALHELATNASKYGALSVSRGSVAVHWKLEPRRGRAAVSHVLAREWGPARQRARAQRLRPDAHRATDGGEARRDRSAHVRARWGGVDARCRRAGCAGGSAPGRQAVTRAVGAA